MGVKASGSGDGMQVVGAYMEAAAALLISRDAGDNQRAVCNKIQGHAQGGGGGGARASTALIFSHVRDTSAAGEKRRKDKDVGGASAAGGMRLAACDVLPVTSDS